ncbi:hypothetical protein L1987_00966 [Smallanthus sonchifolius]|uniref:Uncharacterized protein n=1 Tax=Smallanthus sonchifolius TaxID=185202 RepID=A0ACB9K3K6_9ASTR|nr:hypothetical protein L1987_00966 [Smallanthus sonchifolius]
MTSPPPPNPSTTTTGAATATADFLKSVARQKPRKHLHPAIYQTFYNPQPTPTPTPPFPPPPQRQPSNSRPHHQQPTAGGVLYPVASSGRGFLQNPNSDSFPPRPVSGYPYGVHRPYGLSNSDLSGQLVNPSSAHLQQTLMGVSVSANPKVVGQSSVAADNSLKNTRDKNGDDIFALIRDRKVQVSEGTSLYAQCRSWLKNGLILEKPPQVDREKSLPKPLPASMVEPRNEDDMETEEKTENVEHLSAKELLQEHVKHAKRVRARLRNQRLQRIERVDVVHDVVL